MIALIAALAPRVVAGGQLGVIYPAPVEGYSDQVLVSAMRIEHPGRARRGVALIAGAELIMLYSTSHEDSGHLLASVASLDLFVGL